MEKTYIGLISKNRGGKDSVDKLIVELAEPIEAVVMGFSDPINECLHALGKEKTRENQDTFSTANREAFGQDLLADAMHVRSQRSTADIVVIHGVRRPADTKKLRTLPRFFLVYVDAPAELRFEWMKRANDRVGDAEKTWEQFMEEEQAEPQRLIAEVAEQADIVITNDKDDPSLEDLRAKVKKVLADLLHR